MTTRTHDVIAFSALTTMAVINPPSEITIPTVFACLVGNIVGSLMPDLDQATNRLWDLLPWGDNLARIFRSVFLGHRTLSHSILGLLIFDFLLWKLLPVFLNPSYINPWLVQDAIMIGVISHLAADAITKDGIPLFFPIPVKIGIPPLTKLRIKTGGWIEKYMIMPAMAVYIFWLISKNQEVFINLFQTIKAGTG